MSLKIIDQFPFEFYGDHFTVALARDRNLYVPMESLCRSMGLQTHGQVRRIRDLAGPGAPIPSIFDNPSQKRLL